MGSDAGPGVLDGPYAVQRLALPNTVIDGIDVIVPEAPLGQAAIIVRTALIEAVVVKIPFTALQADRQLVNVGGHYLGHSVKEATGTAVAEIDLYDGTTVGGIGFNPMTFNANESIRDWFPLPGIPIEGGIFAHMVSGSVTGAIYFGIPPARMAEWHRE